MLAPNSKLDISDKAVALSQAAAVALEEKLHPSSSGSGEESSLGFKGCIWGYQNYQTLKINTQETKTMSHDFVVFDSWEDVENITVGLALTYKFTQTEDIYITLGDATYYGAPKAQSDNYYFDLGTHPKSWWIEQGLLTDHGTYVTVTVVLSHTADFITNQGLSASKGVSLLAHLVCV